MLKGDLMGLMVHDLKNPLAALLANLGFVASAVSHDEMAKEAVDDCLLSTEVLTRLVENLSVLSALEEGAGRKMGSSSVEAAVSAMATRMNPHAETSSLGLKTTVEPGCGLTEVPGQVLGLALENMVACSLAYAPPGSVIRVEAAPSGEKEVALRVLDDGAPVSAEMRPLIGDREGQMQTKGAQGARYARGLGLYVVALIARHYGGSMDVEEVSAGSCLLLVLPRSD